MVEILVSDTGSGIPPEKLPHIFDRFYQAGDDYTKDGEGTGIGLALTKELVELHGGRITVESVVNQGSTFEVILPLGNGQLRSKSKEQKSKIKDDFNIDNRQPTTDNQEPATCNVQPATDSTPKDAPLLLVVEDNPDMRLYIRGILGQDYRMLEGGSGKQGLEKALEHVPDLVLTDVMMPEMDGFELTRRLKTDERTSHIPIILLTARAGMESRIEGLETGADDFITKPFDPQELMVRIRNLIQQRKKLQEKLTRMIRRSGIGQITEMDVEAYPSIDRKFLQKVTTYILDHLPDAELDVESLSEATFLSSRQLHRKIIALTGDTPNKFIRSIRLYRAAKMLKSKTGNVTEIAFEVGYNNLSWFAKCFKEEFGVLPSEFSDV
jgi:CheY-like chemotaxis protein